MDSKHCHTWQYVDAFKILNCGDFKLKRINKDVDVVPAHSTPGSFSRGTCKRKLEALHYLYSAQKAVKVKWMLLTPHAFPKTEPSFL